MCASAGARDERETRIEEDQDRGRPPHHGAGKIDAHKLRAGKGTVEANGVATIEVFASEELNVTVSGPASVIYSGDPKLNKKVNGPGSVERRASEGA